uniref:Uncharacterized protein n=1 Tax=Solanum tuberosum TaxID=4113 RepID=M1DWB3_SOLTU
MVNTRFNGVRTVLSSMLQMSNLQREVAVEAGIEEENVDVEDVGQEEEVQAETIDVLPIDPVLAQQIMSFLKGLVGPGVLPSAQAPQAPTNPHVATTVPKVGGTGGNVAFFCLLLGSVMTELRNEPEANPTRFSPFLRLNSKNKRNESEKGRIKFLRVSSLFRDSITNLDWLPRSGITNLDRLPRSGITNLDQLSHSGITMGSIATFRYNYGIRYHVPTSLMRSVIVVRIQG